MRLQFYHSFFMVPFLSFVSPFLFNRFIRVCLPIYSSIYLLIHFFYSSIHLLNHFLHRFFPVNVSLILPYLPSHLSSLFFTLLAHASFFGSGPVGDNDLWFHHIGELVEAWSQLEGSLSKLRGPWSQRGGPTERPGGTETDREKERTERYQYVVVS